MTINMQLVSRKMYILLTILLLNSYVIEQFFQVDFDITLIIIFMLVVMQFLYLLRKGKISLLKPDIIFVLFSSYIFVNEIIRETDLRIIISLIIGSLYPYFFGRLFKLNDFRIFRGYWKLIGISAMGWFLWTIGIYNFTVRTGVYGDSIIAIGEMFGITALFLIVNFIEKGRIHTFLFFVLAFIIMIIYLGSRGALLSLILSALLYYYITSIKKTSLVRKVLWFLIFVLLIICLQYIVSKLNLLDQVPTLARFLPKNILNDVSIIGNSMYKGRISLFNQSWNNFIRYPLFGIGFGIDYPHNIIIEILSAYGIFGFILFLAFFVSIVNTHNLRTILRNKLILVVFVCIVFTFIYRMSSYSLLAHKSFFFFIGALASFINLAKVDVNLKNVQE